MGAFAFGLRDTLEAALIIAFALAALVRLGRGQMAQALWAGVGAGAVLGFSIGTGLAAGQVTASGSGWTGFEIGAMALSLAALVGLALSGRRFAADTGPALWLAVATGFFATTPQMVDLMGRIAANDGGIASLGLLAAGVVLAVGLAALVRLGLIRIKLGQPAAEVETPVSGELAPVRQRID